MCFREILEWTGGKGRQMSSCSQVLLSGSLAFVVRGLLVALQTGLDLRLIFLEV